MTKNQIAVLILIVGLAGGLGYGLGTALIGKKASKPVDVEKVTLIQPSITPPETTVFSPDAINPTVQITIGENNQSPLGN